MKDEGKTSVSVRIKVLPHGTVIWTMSFNEDQVNLSPRTDDPYSVSPTAQQNLFLATTELS